MWSGSGGCRSALSLGVTVDATGGILRLAALQPQRRGASPHSCECVAWPLEPGEPLPQQLSKALQQLSSVPRSVSMALPETVVTRRQLKVSEALSEEELALALLAEAECLVPLPPVELALDYVLLEAEAVEESMGDSMVRTVLREEPAYIKVGTGSAQGLATAAVGAGGHPADSVAAFGSAPARWLELAVCHRDEYRAPLELARAVGLRLNKLVPALSAERGGERLLSGGLQLLGAVEMPGQSDGERWADWRLAVGLAAGGGHNLLPWRLHRRRRADGWLLAAAVTLLLLGQGVALTARSTLQRGGLLQSEDNAVQHRQLAQRHQRAHSDQLRRANELAVNRVVGGHHRRWHRAQQRAMALWAPLAAVRPVGVSYQRIELRDGLFQLEGHSDYLASVSQLIKRLDAQPLFGKVELRQLQSLQSHASGAPAAATQRFVLEMSLSPEVDEVERRSQ